MKSVARLSAIAGLALAVLLFAREDIRSIVALVVAAGPGLLLAALFHVLPMMANARGWQRLFPRSQRPSFRVLTWATWLRESVNGLLPVARIGGEVVAYRVVRHDSAPGRQVAASLLADMALSVFSQTSFALLGLALLFAIGHTPTATTQLLAGVVSMIPLGVGFVLAQRGGALSVLIRLLDRLFAGRLAAAQIHAEGFDDALRAVYERHRDIGACFMWQLGGWMLGAGEIWLALRFLGLDRSLLDAIAIEALIQAVSSAAFMVPAALGVQEGAFVVIGAALGIDAASALALATARRVRDLLIFFPGLIAWQWTETHPRDAGSTGATPLP